MYTCSESIRHGEIYVVALCIVCVPDSEATYIVSCKCESLRFPMQKHSLSLLVLPCLYIQVALSHSQASVRTYIHSHTPIPMKYIHKGHSLLSILLCIRRAVKTLDARAQGAIYDMGTTCDERERPENTLEETTTERACVRWAIESTD